MVLLLRKLYLYFTKDLEGVHDFPGGVKFFPEGGGRSKCYFFLKTIYVLVNFKEGGVWTPYPPLDPHMDNVIITGQYLS